MKICVIGSGYVGLVTGACLANLGNHVACIDKDKKRINLLNSGSIPFYEPGLAEMVKRNAAANRLSFSINLKSAVLSSEVVFIAVGTPPKDSGEADISAIEEVAQQIGRILKIRNSTLEIRNSYKVIVNKSTVPVGMGDIVTKILVEEGVNPKSFSVVSNPEFLREGSAVADFLHPDRIVIGAQDNRAVNIISELYRPLNAHILFTSVKSAELIKYASNAFLAAKISFINEIANICECVGSDVNEVADAVGLDKRIGRAFLNAGIGWGGSCFPKDLKALSHLARQHGYEPQILDAVSAVNKLQIEHFAGKIEKTLKSLSGKTIGVLGLAFKPETDDLRDAPALKLINFLVQQKAKVKVYDPVVIKYRKLHIDGATIVSDPYKACSGSSALVVVTEWPEFREIDFSKVKKLLLKPYIFDGRNIYNPQRIKEYGLKYFGVGR